MGDQPNKSGAQADLLSNWKRKKKPVAKRIPARPAGAIVRPTSGQQRLWLLQRLYPGNAFYQHGHVYELTGELNAAALAESLAWVFDRHEALRTNFVGEADDLRAVTQPALLPTLESRRISPGGEVADPREAANQEAIRFAKQPFDLAEGPLLKALLLELGEGEHWLVLSIHHIIGDRGSLAVLAGDLFGDYTHRLAEADQSAPASPTLPFGDYAYWKAQRGPAEKNLAYWESTLSGELPHSAFVMDRPRPESSSFAGAMVAHSLSPDLSLQLKERAKRWGTTPNVVLLAAFQTLHLRSGAQKDQTTGVPVSLRDRTELESTVGFLNETVVIRGKFDVPEETFQNYVRRLKTDFEKGLEHRDAPFDELVKRVKPERMAGANPLFQNMFVYNAKSPALTLPKGLEVTDRMLDLGVAKFDLTLFVTDTGDAFDLTLEYATDLFDEATVTRLLGNQVALLEDAIARPETQLTHLNIFGEAEREARKNWPPSAALENVADDVLGLIVSRAHDQPTAIAVADGTRELSYASLLNRADQLAAQLIEKGTKTGEFVGLTANRTVDLAVGIIGILRAGAAYVPLDPAYPASRLAYVRKDAGIRQTVAAGYLREELGGNACIDIPTADKAVDFTPPKLVPDSPAYLIYTSGSTGKPKGVPISHANLAHSTAARFTYFNNAPSAFLLLSSFAFDSSVAGIFWTLSQGGKLVVSPERSEQDLAGLTDLIELHEVSHTLLLPSLYQLLLEEAPLGKLRSLKTVMVAGEACNGQTVAAHFDRLPSVELVNEYGPTEGTVWCTAHRMVPADALARVPIGRPIPGVGNHLLDEHLQPVPIGTPGELYISGPGLASGYWQRPGLTAERFPAVALPQWSSGYESPGKGPRTMYRTGDLAKHRANGLIDFLGRVDGQAKIRGHRVEAGEVRAALRALPKVTDAYVRIDQSGPTARLIGYVVGPAQEEVDSLRTALTRDLPAYLVPAQIVSLEAIPLLPNGKVDGTSLPLPQASARGGRPGFKAPTTSTEKVLAGIWRDILGLAEVGLSDNYFDLGGDSIGSIKIITKARKAGLELAPTDLFRYQTLGALAAAVDGTLANENKDADFGDSIIALREAAGEDPLFCIHSGGGHVFFYQPLAAALPANRPVYAIQPSTLASGEALPDTIEEMAADYLREIKKVRKSGPYHLLGTCFSNAVVLEIAHQLRRDGEEVGQLLFIDSGPTQLERQPEVRPPAAASAAKFLLSGNWHKIRRGLYRRWFYLRQAIGATVETVEEKQVRETTNELYQLYFNYDWRPIDARVALIRSSEFAGRSDKKTHLVQWSKLAGRGLRVEVTSGTHLNLFANPQAEGLAKHVEACLTTTTTSA